MPGHFPTAKRRQFEQPEARLNRPLVAGCGSRDAIQPLQTRRSAFGRPHDRDTCPPDGHGLRSRSRRMNPLIQGPDGPNRRGAGPDDERGFPQVPNGVVGRSARRAAASPSQCGPCSHPTITVSLAFGDPETARCLIRSMRKWRAGKMPRLTWTFTISRQIQRASRRAFVFEEPALKSAVSAPAMDGLRSPIRGPALLSPG